jgi:hypothetical protein
MSSPPAYDTVKNVSPSTPQSNLAVAYAEAVNTNSVTNTNAYPMIVEAAAEVYELGDEITPLREHYSSYPIMSSRILFPIAGHPDFDKGAYYNPVGCCCYVNNRQHETCDPSTFLCFPLTLACYVGTCAYQPCGAPWFGFPYLRDCPCTEQRVTSTFARDYPDRVTSTTILVLVPKGSRSAVTFHFANDLKAKRINVPLMLTSGKAVSRLTREKKFISQFSYYSSEIVDSVPAPENGIEKVRYDGNFIWLKGEDMVLDVAMWKYEAGNPVNFVGGGPTEKSGGGRDWVINDDGTISPRHKQEFVLGC